MTEHEKGIVTIASLIAVLITLNFIAVISGIADGYYGQLTEWLKPWLMMQRTP